MKPLADKASKRNPIIVSTGELSEILGFKEQRRIQQLTKQGFLKKHRRGEYILQDAIQDFIDYQISRVAASNDPNEINKDLESALWTRAKKEKTELEVKIIKGELHRSSDVERVMNDMLTSFRQRVLALPTKVAPQLLLQEDVGVIKEILTMEVIDTLSELANYDPNVFYDISGDKMFLDDEESEMDE